MIKIKVSKNDIISTFIKSNERDIEYIEKFDHYEINCHHTNDCFCRRVEKIDRLSRSFNLNNLSSLKTIATLSKNIKLSREYIEEVDNFHNNNKNYLVLIIDCGVTQELSIYSTVYDYKVFETKINSLQTLLNALAIFTYNEIKLPPSLIKNIEIDIKENHISGFEIDFRNYIFKLIRYDKDRDFYVGVFNNIKTGCSILIDKIIINEMDGSVYRCGENPEKLNL